jgi:hypothetical protein
MPYNSYNKHYTNYRELRLEAKPQRNLHDTVYEPVTGATVKFDYEEIKEDTELIQYRWEVAKTKASIAYLEEQKKFHSKLVRFPIAIGNMNLPEFYERTNTESTNTRNFYGDEKYRKASWSERRQSAITSWDVWKNEKIGSLTDYRGYDNDWNIRKKSHKEKVQEEFEYMTTGDGFNYYLNELAIAENLKIHEEVFGEANTLAVFIAENERRVRAQRESLYVDIRKLKNGVQKAMNDLSPQRRSESPYYQGDATKLISSMRSINKKIKDLEQDLVCFKEAFASEWGKNTVLSAFGNTVEEISKKNPYLEKRILWESLLEDTRVIYNNIIERIGSLEQHLESLGTEEEFVAQQEERDKLFRQRYERKEEIKRNLEDRRLARIEAWPDQKEEDRVAALLEKIKKTGYGHGHLSSTGKEKYFYTEFDEAKKAEINMFNQDGRRLDLYPKKISVSFTKWNKERRRRESRERSISGYFHRTFRELKE